MSFKYRFKYRLIQRMQMVADVLAKYDPEDLFKVGAPSDEYDGEAVRIVQEIDLCWQRDGRDADLNMTKNVCETVFGQAFGVAQARDKYDWTKAADEIVEIHRRVHRETGKR